jgi:uncharacterized protein (DUF697 family)
MAGIERLPRILRTRLDRLAALSFLWKAPGRSSGNPRKQEAFRLVKLYTSLSVPGGLVPIPFGDLVVVTMLQLRMLARIAHLYGVPFRMDKTRLLIGAIMLGAPQGMTNGLLAAIGSAATVSWIIVGPGSIVAGIGLGVVEATVTFALGQVFIEHFESGGTLLDIDAAAAREALATKVGRHTGRCRAAAWTKDYAKACKFVEISDGD